MAEEVLTLRDLNRATLARQHLLERVDRPAADEIAHLVGMQAQAPFPPYFGLWSRLASFAPDEVAGGLEDRSLVRTSLQRGTVHLVTADDARWLTPTLQPFYEMHVGKDPATAGKVDGLDLAAVAAAGRALLEEEPRTAKDLALALAERWPDRSPRALDRVTIHLVPTVQLPPRAVWGRKGQTVLTSLEHWIGGDLEAPSLERMVLRYLAAFGPASVMDVQRWCGLTRLTAVVKALRPQLVTFRNEAGKQLFDLPDAPRPGGDAAAPVRLVAAFDNVLLGHDDRTRIHRGEHRKRLYPINGVIPATVLVDGFVAGLWRWEVAKGVATVSLEPLQPWSQSARDEAHAEAERLLALAAPDADRREVVWA